MKIDSSTILEPFDNELPSAYACRIGEQYISLVPNHSKKEKGQFFTPVEIANFIGEQFIVNKKSVSILDPGCGSGILSCALIEKICLNKPIEHIRLVLYELDSEILIYTNKVLNYLKYVLHQRNITLEFIICNDDFVLKNYKAIDLTSHSLFDSLEMFDIIISNPPYFKLQKDDERVKCVHEIIDGQPNIYSIFMAISVGLLKENGEMVFIVPRSFTSGRYFRLFRDFFLKHIRITFIHLFNTRKDTFSKDNVLQETLIIKGIKKVLTHNESNKILLSFSEGIKDLSSPLQKTYLQNELIDINSTEKIIHLPANIKDEAVIKLFKTWSGNLNKYNIQISTGPIVAFRMQKHLSDTFDENTAPLFWLHNIIKMLVDHPIILKDKKQYIVISPHTQSALLPNRNYVFLRRFSAKDDKSRLVAAPYLCNKSDSYYIGVENKLNYIYRPKGHLDRLEVIGIAALMNSDIFDTYFRTFNGSVNVSATELRCMPLPQLDIIKAIGQQLILRNDFSLENVNDIVNSFFQLS